MAGSSYDAGVRLLATRAHSVRELRDKLLRRGHAELEVVATLERLRGSGYLDDAAYARGLISRRSSSRGARAIAAELAAKGVDREAARTALGGLEATDQLEAAVEVARRMLRTAPGGQPDLQRIGPRLLRRGFSMEVARAALRRL
jgi:regulatory protein